MIHETWLNDRELHKRSDSWAVSNEICFGFLLHSAVLFLFFYVIYFFRRLCDLDSLSPSLSLILSFLNDIKYNKDVIYLQQIAAYCFACIQKEMAKYG